MDRRAGPGARRAADTGRKTCGGGHAVLLPTHHDERANVYLELRLQAAILT